MNPRRALALLGPRAPSLTRLMHRTFGLGGSGGGTTPQDAAAALSFIGNRMAVDVYLLLWFPDWAQRHGERVEKQVATLLQGKWARESAAGRWPTAPPAGLACRDLSRAVLFELGHGNDCGSCNGCGKTGRLEDGQLVIEDCGKCSGKGVRPYSNALRAQLLRVRRATFDAAGVAPYSWLLATLRTLEREAAQAHFAALREDAAGPSLPSSRSARSTTSR